MMAPGLSDWGNVSFHSGMGSRTSSKPVMTDTPSVQPPSALLLRNLSGLWGAATSVVRARGMAIVGTALLVWSVFAGVLILVVRANVNVSEASRLYEQLVNPNAILEIDATQSAAQEIASGTWLFHGWGGVATGLVLLVVLYLLCATTANIAVTEQSYAWLTDQRKASFAGSLVRALRRSLPGSIILAIYLSVVVLLVAATTAVGGVGAYMALSTLVPDASLIVQTATTLVFATLGLMAGAAIAVWVYTVWSVSPYAVALSPHPWSALSQSQALTKGHRLDVFIRLLLVLVVVGVLTAVLSLPFDALLGVLPFVVGGIAPFAIAMYLRVAISAVSPLISTAALLSVYLDLGGATPARGRGESQPDT